MSDYSCKRPAESEARCTLDPDSLRFDPTLASASGPGLGPEVAS